MIAKADFSFGEVHARAAMPAQTPTVPAQDEHSRMVDSTLEDSFPASDPPSWTASVARPAPAGEVVVRATNARPIRTVLQRAAALF